MRVAFVRPSLDGGRAYDGMEPLAFAALQAVTPPEVRTRLYDERLAPLPARFDADLVAITVETYTARRAYQIADAARRQGVPVVLGGYHPTFLPDEASAHADALVLGDGEGAWPDVLADAAAGRLQPRYRARAPIRGEAIAFDRTVFDGLGYTRVAPVQAGRGCVFACDFCSIHAFYGNTLIGRPPEAVAEEIRRQVRETGRRNVLIVDDNLFVNAAQARALFEALLPLGIRWGCQVSLNVADDEDLLDLMARSGCVAALVGFESLDEDNLAQMRKRFNTARGPYAEAIRRFHARGIMVYGSFVFGYDHDDAGCFARTAQFALDHRLFLVNFSALTPTPATRLYRRLEAEGRLLYPETPWWLAPGYRYGEAAFRPARMTADELTEGCLRARRAFYRPASVWRRAFNREANARSPARLALYLGANVMSAREIRRKLGRPLGAPMPEALA